MRWTFPRGASAALCAVLMPPPGTSSTALPCGSRSRDLGLRPAVAVSLGEDVAFLSALQGGCGAGSGAGVQDPVALAPVTGVALLGFAGRGRRVGERRGQCRAVPGSAVLKLHDESPAEKANAVLNGAAHPQCRCWLGPGSRRHVNQVTAGRLPGPSAAGQWVVPSTWSLAIRPSVRLHVFSSFL